jgi:hypothetical protein
MPRKEQNGATERAVHPADHEKVARPLRGRVMNEADDHEQTSVARPFHGRVYPARLYHEIPSWVPNGAVFHIRIRCDRTNPVPLTDPTLAQALLDSVRSYDERLRWYYHLAVLMSDHRIRNEAEFDEKAAYIRRNPAAKGLCQNEEEWPWTLSRAW